MFSMIYLGEVSILLFLYYKYREKKLESILKTYVKDRNLEQNLNFALQESGSIERASRDTSSCREIIIRTVPEQLSTIQIVVALAEKKTSLAETLFLEGAFTPFWDAVDEVIDLLRSYDESIDDVRRLSSTYYYHLDGTNREHNFPPFPMRGDELPKLDSIFERLQAVISKAHRNFQFTQIYEQRKTTSAVLDGFSSLGQAISHLRNDIVRSMDDLRDSVDSGFRRVSTDVRSLESSQNQNAEELRDFLKSQHAEQRDGDKDRSERDDRYQRQSDETLRSIRKNTTRE